ncbi:MAG: hypothetical protein VKI82_06895 [Leptolyngbya sp.]|nr:hypothetical protein [Leptolyngbya sp.]
MAPKKLTEADKAAILGLYRQPEETTSTLAERYGVSNSTISRLLKASLPEADYKALIQQKRGAADKDSAAPPPVTKGIASPGADLADPPSDRTGVTAETAKPEVSKAPPILKKRNPTTGSPEAGASPAEDSDQPTLPSEQGKSRRRRGRSTQVAAPGTSEPGEETTQLALSTEAATETVDAPSEVPAPRAMPVKKSAAKAQDPSPEEDWDTDAPTLGDDYNDDDDDDDDEDEDWDGDAPELAPHLEVVEIAPLTPSDLPPQCYLVVERVSSELVVLPLKTFASLGQIPEEEGDCRTLPVFDNHRVARRFSRRNQRVIKVPDGNLLQTTRPYLQAKGITRLLIDGHVFALEDKAVETPV